MAHVAVALGVLLLGLTPKEEASRLITRAKAAFDKGDHLQSAQLYLQARDVAREAQLGGIGAMTFNAALGFHQAGQCARAVTLYRELEQIDPAAAAAAKTYKERRTSAERCAPDLEIVSEPAGAEVLLNNESLGRAPIVSRPTAAGKYRLQLRLEGYRSAKRSITIREGQPTRVVVQLVAVPPPPAPPPKAERAPAPLAEAAPKPAPAVQVEQQKPRPKSRAPWPWITGAGAVLAAGTAGILHGLAYSKALNARDDFVSLDCDVAGVNHGACGPLEQTYNENRNPPPTAIAGYIAGGVLAGVTIVLLMLDDDEDELAIVPAARGVFVRF